MSRWLRSVNTILDSLDGTVEEVVEAREEEAELLAVEEEAALLAVAEGGVDAAVGADIGTPALASKTSVDDILARRGLLTEDDEDDEEDDHEKKAAGGDGKGKVLTTGETRDGCTSVASAPTSVTKDLADTFDAAGGTSPAEPSMGSFSGPEAGGLAPPSSSAGTAAEYTGAPPPEMTVPAAVEAEVGSGLEAPSAAGGATDSVGGDAVVVAPPPVSEDVLTEVSSAPTSGQVDIPSGSDSAGTATPSSSAPPSHHGDSATEFASTPPQIDLAAAAVHKAVMAAEARAEAEAAETALLEQTRVAEQKTREAKEYAKEVRKLRRHVVKLNAELEAAEREMGAQRTELERAAARMDKDRARTKEEKERMEKEHKEEVARVEAEHKAAVEEERKKHERRVKEMEDRVRQANEARQREGGDWNKELKDAMERERELTRKVMLLEDEKSTLTGRVSALESQAEATSSRLRTATENADTAMEREREADDRLDAALSLHARQIGQRQAREAELERTVTELGAALVAAKQRELSRGQQMLSSSDGTGAEEGADRPQELSLRQRLEAAEEEAETTKAQLALELRQRETLQEELRDISRERSEEASAAQTRQKRQDRIVADLTANVARLKAALRDRSGVDDDSGDEGVEGSPRPASGEGSRSSSSSEKAELRRQISVLTKQVMQHQARSENSSVEISTLRNRLRSALTRAETAEKALAESANNLGGSPLSGDFDVEKGLGGGVRRRGASGKKASRSRHGAKATGAAGANSMRSALMLEPGRGGEAKEQIGTAVDAVDRAAMDTGSFLRYNPLARAGFLLYLVMLHMWTFCVLVFHAHTYQPESSDVGHGPHALLSYRHMEQLQHKTP